MAPLRLTCCMEVRNHLSGKKRYGGMFSNMFYRKNVAAVVCDEVHNVVHW